jgi:hypothetical protein
LIIDNKQVLAKIEKSSADGLSDTVPQRLRWLASDSANSYIRIQPRLPLGGRKEDTPNSAYPFLELRKIAFTGFREKLTAKDHRAVSNSRLILYQTNYSLGMLSRDTHSQSNSTLATGGAWTLYSITSNISLRPIQACADSGEHSSVRGVTSGDYTEWAPQTRYSHQPNALAMRLLRGPSSAAAVVYITREPEPSFRPP